MRRVDLQTCDPPYRGKEWQIPNKTREGVEMFRRFDGSREAYGYYQPRRHQHDDRPGGRWLLAAVIVVTIGFVVLDIAGLI